MVADLGVALAAAGPPGAQSGEVVPARDVPAEGGPEQRRRGAPAGVWRSQVVGGVLSSSSFVWSMSHSWNPRTARHGSLERPSLQGAVEIDAAPPEGSSLSLPLEMTRGQPAVCPFLPPFPRSDASSVAALRDSTPAQVLGSGRVMRRPPPAPVCLGRV